MPKRQDRFFREFLKHENGWQNPDPRSEEQQAVDYLEKLIGEFSDCATVSAR